MKQVFLCYESTTKRVWLQDSQSGLAADVRRSPLYSLAPKPSLKPREGVFFGFTTDTFHLLGSVKDELPKKSCDSLYTSHGLASLILFFEQEKDVEILRQKYKTRLVAWEKWLFDNDGRIRDSSYQVSSSRTVESIVLPKAEDLDLESKVVFDDILDSLTYLLARAEIFVPHYVHLFCELRKKTVQLALNIMFLQGRLTETEFLQLSELDDAEDTLAKLSRLRLSGRDCIIRIHQLRDESVQVSSLLRSLNSQVFGSLPPLQTSTYVPGRFSLLGIGSVATALLAIYAKVHRVFSNYLPDEYIREHFHDKECPRLLSYSNYGNWFRELQRCDGLAEIKKVAAPGDVGFHIPYFSTRLGFRETKHGISAASQTLRLAALPTWSLCTLSHEYLHAHASSLLAILFPRPGSEEFDKVYGAYVKHQSSRGLFRFIQLIILRVATALNKTSGKWDYDVEIKPLEKEKLVAALKRHSDLLEEAMVHVLDFHYFYEADVSIYVRAIWSSWLTLPIVVSRVPEYLLRTICAISTVRLQEEPSRQFWWCVEKVRQEIAELRRRRFILQEDADWVESVLGDQKELQKLHRKFYALKPFVDVVGALLISKRIKSTLLSDDLLIEDDSDRYTYGLSVCIFEAIRIGSPSMLLYDFLRKGIEEANALERIEAKSLWLFLATNSYLHHDAGGGGKSE